jgi:hypothetical protein
MKIMQDLRATGRKAFGPDFDVTVAKHADFGDACCELLIYGKQYREAAASLSVAGSVVTILQGRRSRDGSAYEYAALRMPLKS